MKIKLSPIAVAVAALCLSPLAVAGAYVNGSQTAKDQIAVAGYNAPNNAKVNGKTMEGASGNIGAMVKIGV